MDKKSRGRPPRLGQPSERELAYGAFAGRIIKGTELYKALQSRCAYVAITGQFPSHIRKETTAILRQVTEAAKNSSLDGRSGYCALKPWPFQHLNISKHPMYLAVRGYIQRGYRIRPSRGPGTRRGYGQIFLFLEAEGGALTHQITIKEDGAVRQGW